MWSNRLLVSLAIAAVSVGILVRIALVDVGSWWLDELWTLDAISRTYKEMIGARLVSDQSPPLATSATWLWLQAVGTYDVRAMRAFPIALSILGIAAPLYGAIRMPRLRSTLLVMVALLALSAFSIHYSVELRPYAMMIALESWATVIWAGLVTRQLPRTLPYLFAFAAFGALGGFAHYYGNLAYVAESAVLLVVLARSRDARITLTHVGLGALSMVPVVGWYIFSRPWAPNEAVAGPPSLATLLTLMDYALAPVTTVLRGTAQGYPTTTFATLSLLAVLGAAAIWIVARSNMTRDGDEPDEAPTMPRLVGAALGTIALATAAAFVASLVLPPSMNFRNLAAILPITLLGVAAITTATPPRIQSVVGSAVITVFLLAFGLLVMRYGVAALAPPWQQSAGYRDAARMLIQASTREPAPQLVGVETSWQWHGQWDAAIRSELGSPPAVSSDSPPVPIVWIPDTASIAGLQVDPDGAILFTDTTDDRWVSALAWASQRYIRCQATTYGGSTATGGDAFGLIRIVTCQ
jgi:hypothetical protein